MKTQVFLIILAAAWILGCDHPTAHNESGLQGRVYANAGPGYHEYPGRCTILVSKSGGIFVTESATDSLGIFKIAVAAGTYFLNVKESPDTLQSGPFEVTAGRYTDSKAYYYNSMVF